MYFRNTIFILLQALNIQKQLESLQLCLSLIEDASYTKRENSIQHSIRNNLLDLDFKPQFTQITISREISQSIINIGF